MTVFVKLPPSIGHLSITDIFFKTRGCPLFRGFTVSISKIEFESHCNIPVLLQLFQISRYSLLDFDSPLLYNVFKGIAILRESLFLWGSHCFLVSNDWGLFFSKLLWLGELLFIRSQYSPTPVYHFPEQIIQSLRWTLKALKTNTLAEVINERTLPVLSSIQNYLLRRVFWLIRKSLLHVNS